MLITLSSKNLELTEGLKTFLTSRIIKLQRFTSKISHIHVLLDVNRRHKGTAIDSTVELIGDVGGRKIAVRESSNTFYKAFFGAVDKMKVRIKRVKKD